MLFHPAKEKGFQQSMFFCVEQLFLGTVPLYAPENSNFEMQYRNFSKTIRNMIGFKHPNIDDQIHGGDLGLVLIYRNNRRLQDKGT